MFLFTPFAMVAKTDGNRYSYCNIFENDFCIGIARGDKITVSQTMDFRHYDILLANGASLSMYYGRHPSPIVELAKLESNFETETLKVQIFAQSKEEYR